LAERGNLQNGVSQRYPCSRRILVREGRAEPATSVSNATHIQVVSSATRDQTDPLAPAGRRFGNFVFAIFPLGANAGGGRRGAGRALGGTGYRQTGGIERSALSYQRHPCWRRFLARARAAQAATSVRGATHIQQRDLGQQSDPPAPPGRRLAAVASSF
jgi:hypothetical protein